MACRVIITFLFFVTQSCTLRTVWRKLGECLETRWERFGLDIRDGTFFEGGGGVALVNYQKINSRRAKRAEKKFTRLGWEDILCSPKPLSSRLLKCRRTGTRFKASEHNTPNVHFKLTTVNNLASTTFDIMCSIQERFRPVSRPYGMLFQCH